MPRRVTCPGCQTQLQIPDSMGAGKIKCPKCAKVLAIKVPNATATPVAPIPVTPVSAQPLPATPATPAAQDPFGDPFGNLPNIPAASAPGAPAARPLPGAPPYRNAPPPAKKQTKKKKKSGGGGNMAKVLGTLGGIAGLALLVCGGIFGLAASGVLGPRHSGWKVENFLGYSVKMPGKGKTQTKNTPTQGVVIKELGGQRAESGSQYFIVVSPLPPTPAGIEVSLERLIAMGTTRLQNKKPVTRDGHNGFSGTVSGGFQTLAGSEVEMFKHNRNLVIMAYAPYSKIKSKVGGTMKPRSNERELDKPEEFFASIKFP